MSRPSNIPNVQKRKAEPVKKTGLLIPQELRTRFETACHSNHLSMTAVTITLWEQWLQQVDGAFGAVRTAAELQADEADRQEWESEQ